MSEEKHVVRGKMEVAGLMGPIWVIGWLFTIGYAELPFGRALIAIVLWPYYLGSSIA